MSTRRLLFQYTSTIKIQLSVLVKYKADLIIILLKINLLNKNHVDMLHSLLFSSGHLNFCHYLASVVHSLSLTLTHFDPHLWNYWTGRNQTLQELYLQGHLQRFLIWNNCGRKTWLLLIIICFSLDETLLKKKKSRWFIN